MTEGGPEGRVIGIDLGTTFSVISCANSAGTPEIVINRDGENLTPSVVLFQGDFPLVGTMAKRSAVTAPLDTVQFVKRQMGDPHWRFETSEGTKYSPEEVSAVILKRLKEDAELFLGEPVADAVITVPAYFDDARRRATIDAGRIAGLTVHRVLNEPTAAALAYGLATQLGGTILVYDLGGGTFDVTAMRVGDGEFDVLATDGDRNLGGFDFDNCLMEWLNAQFQEAGGPDLMEDDVSEADLREKAEMAKRSLSSIPKANVALTAGGVSKMLPVPREVFDDLTRSLVNRTRDLTTSVVEEAGLTFESFDRILLVGGSTRMPAVRAMMEMLTGKQAERSINPDEVVALGAGILAHMTELDRAGVSSGDASSTSGIVIRDVTSQALGVVALNETDTLANSVIIPRNTKIPSKRSQLYSTTSDQQRAIDIEVTQGDDPDLRYVTIVGRRTLEIPPHPRGAPIEVVFAYDIDQTIFVEVIDHTAKQSLGTFEIDGIANLSDDEVSAARLRLETQEIG